MYHHDPENDKIVNMELLNAVHVSNWYASKLLGVPSFERLNDKSFEILGFEQREFEDNLQNFKYR